MKNKKYLIKYKKGEIVMKEYGYIKEGAFVNRLHLGNPKENAKEIIKGLTEGIKKEVAILLTPELSLTGYTCGDMFLQDKLLKESLMP